MTVFRHARTRNAMPRSTSAIHKGPSIRATWCDGTSRVASLKPANASYRGLPSKHITTAKPSRCCRLIIVHPAFPKRSRCMKISDKEANATRTETSESLHNHFCSLVCLAFAQPLVNKRSLHHVLCAASYQSKRKSVAPKPAKKPRRLPRQN